MTVERADEVGRGEGEEIESEISSGDTQRQGGPGEGGDQEARNKRKREEREENQAPSTWYITLPTHPLDRRGERRDKSTRGLDGARGMV